MLGNLTAPVQVVTSKSDILIKLEELDGETNALSLMTKLDKLVFEAEMKVKFVKDDDINSSKFKDSIVMFKCTDKQLLHSSRHGTNVKENDFWCEELARLLHEWRRTAWVSSIEDDVISQNNVIVLYKKVIYQELDFMQDTAFVNNDEWDINGGEKLRKILGWTAVDLAKFNSSTTQENKDERRDFLKSFEKDVMKVHDDQLKEFKGGVYMIHMKRMAVERIDANTASSKGGMFEH